MNLVIHLFISLQFLLLAHYSDGRNLVILNHENKTITLNPDEDVTEATVEFNQSSGGIVAKATIRQDLNKTGWNILDVWGNPNEPDPETSYSAGLVEGIVTGSYIYQHWYNTRKFFCVNQKEVCSKIDEFLSKNNDYIKAQISTQKNDSAYWYQVYLYYEQVRGIADGYKIASERSGLPNLSISDIMLMNYEGDLFDLVDKFKNSTVPSKLYEEGHCSAIIKVLPKQKDLYVAHNSWFKYYAMNRMLKRYSLHYRELPNSDKRIPGHITTFSSYPAKVNSFDDYYLISSGLVVLETTIGNSNSNLWNHVNPDTVLEAVRVVVANRLAKDGKSWSHIFKKHNSGTYNNQWMVIDYKKFKPKTPLKKGLLWILEEIPGHIQAADQTNILNKHKYWPSYNIPYYKNIFVLSGNEELVKLYGHWYSYSEAPRAKIMKRDHKKIKDLNSLMSFMRSNDYKHDPYARCNCTPPYTASAAIASRHDLNPINGSYPLRILAHREGGAIDAKLTNSEMVKELKFIAVSGPTTGKDLPVFKWSTSGFGDTVPHLGLADEWNFKPIITEWPKLNVPSELKE